jgi:hypothetical protein
MMNTRYHSDNWLFTASRDRDGDTLRLRVFLTIHPSGMVESQVRTLDGGLLRDATGMLTEQPYYTRNGRYAMAYAVHVYNRIGTPSAKMLDTEKDKRAAAYRLADLLIDSAIHPNNLYR